MNELNKQDWMEDGGPSFDGVRFGVGCLFKGFATCWMS